MFGRALRRAAAARTRVTGGALRRSLSSTARSSPGWYDAHVFGGNWAHPQSVRKPCTDGKAERPDRLVHEADGARVIVFNDKLEALVARDSDGGGGGSTLLHKNFLHHRADAWRDGDISVFLGVDPEGREHVAVHLAGTGRPNGAAPAAPAAPAPSAAAVAAGDDPGTPCSDGVGGRAGLLPAGGVFMPLRAAAIKLRSGGNTARDLALAGQARNVLLWHSTARFCGRCGGATRTALARRVRVASNMEFKKKKKTRTRAHTRTQCVRAHTHKP